VRVGLTGGIASGKSVAAEELRRLGCTVIDYDQLARQAITPGSPGESDVVIAFGPDITGPEGSVDRVALARLIYANPSARRRLESIIHPLVFSAAALEEAAAVAAGQSTVVHEIPLLAEVGDPADFDTVIVVDAPAEVRLKRLMEDRGFSPEEAGQRLAAQVSDEERRAIADLIWDGSAGEADLAAQARAWFESLCQ